MTPLDAISVVCSWEDGHTRVVPFGSMRFGGVTKLSDLDVCLVVDSSKCRAHIAEFIAHIRDSVEYVIPVLDTYVPVVKFRTRSGLACDVVFCFTTLESVTTGTFDTSLCLNWLEYCVSCEDERSLHGVLATESVLARIPEHRKRIFPRLLQATKEWAQARDIYSNPMGYLNGMALAIMCAFVCIHTQQDYPDSMLFRQFIRIFASWDWGAAQVTVVAPYGPVVPMRAMNVITPTHAPINALHNVGASQFAKIRREFAIALEQIHLPVFEYEDAVPSFFYTNQTFVAIRVTDFPAWCARIESRIKRLIGYLENIDAGPNACTRVWARRRCTWMFVALAKRLTNATACARFLHELTPFPESCTVTVDVILQKDLPAFVLQPDS